MLFNSIKLKIFVYTDLVTPEVLDVIRDFILRVPLSLTFLFFVESKILYKLVESLVAFGSNIEVFSAFSRTKNLESSFVQKSLEILDNYDKVTLHDSSSAFVSEKDAIKLRNQKILESCDLILFGELLSNGIGLALASIAIEKNKKIICCLPSYFSYGYAGIELLINSGSATLLTPKDFEN